MTAEFIISNSRVESCPDTRLPEFAFIGRSNVGKSSLINKLVGRPGLAKASSTPGKTLLINHFLINGGTLPSHREDWPSLPEIVNRAGKDACFFVDLPGYGYARISQKEREKLKKMIEGYCLRREQMYCLFVLIDVRHEPQKVDTEFMAFLAENGVPFAMVFTKADKLGKGALAKNVDAYKRSMLEEWEELPPMFITSAESGLGTQELLEYINSIVSENA